ncbi:hypothetical protein HGRIS_014957 [Hohenbuehelia grisea]|uniref:Transmembrane protein n=1 Tax=Hohenbuehelia grisea TaxID=104357 RepID=A0ABR3IZ52_9AGAR
MPSFKALSLIASFAFAAFTVATPMPAPAPFAELAVRGDYKPVPQILEECHSALIPLAVDLEVAVDLKKTDIEIKAAIEVVVTKIKTVIDISIKEGEKCKGQKEDDYLYHGGKKWTVKEIAVLLCSILELIFFAIFKVLKLLTVLKHYLVLGLFKDICVLVAVLLKLLFLLVTGLLAELLPLILVVKVAVGCSVASIIVFLGCIDLIVCLGGLLGVVAVIF